MADPENRSAVDGYLYFLYIVLQFFPKNRVSKSRGPPPYLTGVRIFNPTPIGFEARPPRARCTGAPGGAYSFASMPSITYVISASVRGTCPSYRARLAALVRMLALPVRLHVLRMQAQQLKGTSPPVAPRALRAG